MRRLPRHLALSAVLVLSAKQGFAQCTTMDEARAVFTAARRLATCNDRVLVDGADVSCPPVTSPDCAGSLVADTVALAYGQNDPPLGAVDATQLSDQLECQRLIGYAATYFVGAKLMYLMHGLSDSESTLRARKPFADVASKCLVNVSADAQSGVTVPAVGPQCAADVGALGHPVDARGLSDAMVTLLGTWVERIGPHAEPLQPNIILILTDDQRADTITSQFMPKLNDELLSAGVNFPNGFASNPVCCPSRSTILTGQYAHTHGVLTNGQGDPQHPTGGAWAFSDGSTVATWLQTAGYHTGLFGKYLNEYKELSDAYALTHDGVQYVPPGWDRWLAFRDVKYWGPSFINESGAVVETDPGTCTAEPPAMKDCPMDQPSGCPYSTDYLRDQALVFINESTQMKKPFFLYLALNAPHLPACPAARHQGMFHDIAPYRPPSFDEGAPGHDPDTDKPQWVQQQGPIHPRYLDALRIHQLETLPAVDEALEAIMTALRAAGEDRRTFIVYYSDNGYLWGEHRRSKKSCPYEECIRVPFIVRYPPLAPLARTDAGIVGNIDLAPTFAELAGVSPIPRPVDGDSIVRLLDGTASWRPDILAEHWGPKPKPGDTTPSVPTFAVVHGSEWKYTEYCTGERELYDLQTDPYELANAASSQPAVVADLAQRLRAIDPDWPDSLPFKCADFSDTEDDND